MRALFVTHDLSDPKRVDFGFTQGRALDLQHALPGETPCGIYTKNCPEVYYTTGSSLMTVLRKDGCVQVEPCVENNGLYEAWAWEGFCMALETEPSKRSRDSVTLSSDAIRFELNGVSILAYGPIGVRPTYNGRVSWAILSNRFKVEGL